MEGAREISEAVQNSAEALRLKGKADESSPRSGNGHLMRSFISPDADWQTISHARPESPGSASQSTSNADTMVEELTLNNFKYPSLSLPSSSMDENEKQGMGLWHNFYKLVGQSRDKISQESISTENGTDVGNFSLNQLGAPRLPAQNNSKQSNPNVFENLPGNDNHAVRGNTTTALRTKVLPSSGFPQFLVKSTLKGKGVAFRHPAIPAVATKSCKVERLPKDSMKGLPEKLQDYDARVERAPSIYDGGGMVASNYPYGASSLRHWLKPGKHILNKDERLQIFRHIVELVDSSHSKGLALQHLRPSYFMILPSNQVKYVGSFASQAEQQYGSVDTQANGYHQATDHRFLGRKRNFIYNNEKSDMSPVKYHKLNEDTCSAIPSLPGGVLRSELTKLSNFEKSIAGNHWFDPGDKPVIQEHQQRQSDFNVATISSKMTTEIMQLEERWYTTPDELSGSACRFTSNIYSLGVLLFELSCCFESREMHAMAMLDLSQRILPSTFLSESPMEASFSLWLLHPEPSSRPKSREVLCSDLVSKTQTAPSIEQSTSSFDEEDAEAELLLHFLLTLKENKERQSEKLMGNLSCLGMDIEEVEKRHSSRVGHRFPGRSNLNNLSDKKLCREPTDTSLIEERLTDNLDQLENAYFSMRSRIELPETNAAERIDKDVLRNREKNPVNQNDDDDDLDTEHADHVGNFFDGLCKYARYSKFEVRGTLQNGDMLNSANVICSISFDRDEEYFAAAGVSKKIKIFEYASLLSDTVDIHYPVVEMSNKSKLSCVCWNSYIKNYLASTDYDGTVQLWDASTGQGFSQYTEHQRRAWSVDFSHINPTKFASGSDDCFVKLWSINTKNSTNTIRNVANVCCVQFSPHSSNLLAFGSADYKINCYDLRNTRIPWCTLAGHGKAVSYVKFVDSETLVSASTDNTLKLWDLNKTCSSGLSTNACSLTFSGHTNEKNFVGLSVSNGYISCGSETNEVYAYYKSLPMPITSHKFGTIDPISGQEIEDDNGQFVSSVCWREKSDMVVAANSSGCIKLLQML